MASDLLNNDLVSGLNTPGTYSTPELPGKAQRAEHSALAIPVRKPEATESENVCLHRNDLRRSLCAWGSPYVQQSSTESYEDPETNAEMLNSRGLHFIPKVCSKNVRNFVEPAISLE